MTVIATEAYRLSNVVKDEFKPEIGFCRKHATLYGSAASLKIGTILGKLPATASVSAVTGTGNGVFTIDATNPVLAGHKVGAYRVTCTTAAANGGTFTVTDPDGFTIGTVAVGATFSNDIKFVIADGSSDFVVGDYFVVTLTAVDKYKPCVQTAVDGSATVAAVLMEDLTLPATTDTKALVMVKGPATLSKAGLVMDATYNTADEKAQVYADLAALNINVLDSATV